MNVYTMPGVTDMGMVWMGAGQPNPEISMDLMSTDNNDLLLEQDNSYFTPSLNSVSNQSIEDIHAMHASHMDGMENLDMMHYIDMKHESNDSSYAEDDGSHPVYMITTATQTLPCPTRKIKPIKHPGLVLKTPIAYQSNTDPSVIPIQKDGIAVCEKCGAIGVKHAFYTRERRFCSMACARGYSGLIPEPLPITTQQQQQPDNQQFAKHRFTMTNEDEFTDDMLIDQELPQLPPPPPPPPPPQIIEQSPSTRKKNESYNWDKQLSEIEAAPVTCFKHAPLSDIWNSVMVGFKIEVENTDCDNTDKFNDSFWVATILKIIGYKALLRYEGFGGNDSKDFWITLCSNQIHSVGWCATKGKPLIPPKTIENKYNDWKEFLCKRLTGARTLPTNFCVKATESLKSRFKCGLNLEVVDKNHISQVKLAYIYRIVGKRLNVKYFDLAMDDAGFWCHEDSPLLHPVGWAKRVGHNLIAPVNYLERINHCLFDDDDATDELFLPYQNGTTLITNNFQIGMKLEAIDPLNLSSICCATVMSVLNYGYIMIKIDKYDTTFNGADWFCYHIKSPCIFPIGFCDKYDIKLVPPKNFNINTFNWQQYLNETNNVEAPIELFSSYIPMHGFMQGMKIEAADLMDPRLVCVATIAKVAGRLLKVHFDGWDDEYDQWLDCESPDIYPVGWCQSVGHKLEGPPTQFNISKIQLNNKLNKTLKKRGRKKKITIKDEKLNKINDVYIKTDLDDDNYELNDEIHIKHEIDINNDNGNMDVSDEPETGQEPAGPDQNLPISTDNPPLERKVPSYISNQPTSNSSTKLIPRLVDSSGGNYCETGELCPNEWNVFDVAQFLRVNDCANYCDSFSKQKVDGKTLMNLNKEDILEYTGGKVGPSLKIFDLIQQLKIKVNPSQIRHMKANIKKFL